MAATKIPNVLWAQRKDQIYITFDIPDVKDAKIDIQEKKVSFAGTSQGNKYQVELDLFGEIDVAKSKQAVRPRSVELVLQKKTTGPFWERLLKEGGKRTWLKADWNKWKDEDDLDEEDAGFDTSGFGGFDPSSMNFGGEGADSDDSDDDLPSLEKDLADVKKGTDDEEEDKTKDPMSVE